MRVYADFRAVPPGLECAVTIGNFDGLHRGHTALLQTVRRVAEDRGLRLAVLTFEPHPLALLAPARAPLRVVSAAEKRRLLAEAGVEVLLEQPFRAEFAALSPEAFAAEVLVRALGARHVAVGYDFRYGAGRAGDGETLRAAGERLGFSVTVIEALGLGDGTPASSSLVRRAVLAGDLPRAAAGLGRPYALVGTVVHGDRRGRTLGFPTANLATDAVLLPPVGVYAGWLDSGAGPQAAVINLGRRPTFTGGEPEASVPLRIEAHVLDRAGLDLYGRRVRLHFAEALRPERRFEGGEALRQAIADDIARARQILGAPAPT